MDLIKLQAPSVKERRYIQMWWCCIWEKARSTQWGGWSKNINSSHRSFVSDYRVFRIWRKLDNKGNVAVKDFYNSNKILLDVSSTWWPLDQEFDACPSGLARHMLISRKHWDFYIVFLYQFQENHLSIKSEVLHEQKLV